MKIRRLLVPGHRAVATTFVLLCASPVLRSQDFGTSPFPAEPIVVTATRLPVPEDRSPAAISVITAADLAARQTDRVADALRAVPGLNVVQTGGPGQLTSVFTRGLESRHTEVLLDGIPINQGLQGGFNFADLTGDDIERIEVQRGPQSTLYGPRAVAGVIQLFSRRGDEVSSARPVTAEISSEGGSFDTFRERVSVAGTLGNAAAAPPDASKDAKGGGGGGNLVPGPGVFDYSMAASRLDTDNDRQNNQYRNTAVLTHLGFAPAALALGQWGGSAPRLGLLFTYANSDTGDPGTVGNLRPLDNLLTERQLYAPNVDWQLTRWWHHRLVLGYDSERQVNRPNADGFVGATRGQFNRYQLDYQNDIEFTHWLTVTTGAFYENAFAYQRRPFISQAFGPQPQYVKDFSESASAFGQVSLTPCKDALLVAGGRYDHFNRAGEVSTYRVAGSYLYALTGTTLRSSVATGFSPPTPQDRIFSFNPTDDLRPEKSFGYDFGFEQALFKNRLRFGANYFHDDLSNVIGGDSFGNTFNLGSARTQGLEAFGRWEPIDNLIFNASYTYLDAVNTSGANFANQEPGGRLPRRARNEGFASVSYRACDRATVSFEGKFVNGREDIGFLAPTFSPQNFDLGGYTILRLVARVDVTPNFQVYGRVENLGDEKYQEVYGYPALRRGLFGGASYHF